MNNEILEKAKEIGVLIQNSEEYKVYTTTKVIKEADKELEAEIAQFNLLRMTLMNEMEKPERDEDNIALLNRDLQNCYQTVIGNAVMSEFIESQKGLEKIISQVNDIFNFYIESNAGCDSSKCGGCSGCK